MQVIWSGTISFSLVAIPVQLIKAVEQGRVSFRMLHNKDYSPLHRRMYCPVEDKIVQPKEIIRGYEISPDKYVVITDEELESVTPERSRTIEILEFIDIKEVDPVYFDHPYYLVPAKGGEKAYQLLAEAMARTNRAGLSKFVLGEREYFVAVKSTGGVLTLITLHYSEEILPDETVPQDKGKTATREKGHMKQNIKKLMGAFDPEKYADQRRKKIMDLLKKKMKDITPVAAPRIQEEEGEGPADLVAALRESMLRVQKKR